jgi:F-type H+-transporting ATPase subunit alpha
MINSKNILKQLENDLMTFEGNPRLQNVGKVEKNTDGVIIASGLSKATMGEQVVFENGEQGVVLNLTQDNASIILLGSADKIREGHTVKTTGKSLSINASDDLLGRVVDPIGLPIDGKAKIKKDKSMPLEKIAPGVVERSPVDTPIKTGLKAIDSMIPIGRGQRELIIGDRGLGKTAIAVDTIINQKKFWSTKKSNGALAPVICIYVAIGQKQSTTAQIWSRLTEEGSMDYTIIVAASSSDPAALQYLAPYSGCAIAEYFLEKGKDVLIVYDDLTKHAWAYRQISLVLRRPAGREAYPGDIFYLHSRLLERAVRLNKEHGGGSITALPIIETQADDVSAYIPTNVISITDGQIYLQSDLFYSGMRPAINAGISVSRVGGAAQTGSMKSVAGKLRLELAQYRELAAFSQFGSDLDPATSAQLERGKRTSEILKQPQYTPLSEPLQVLSIWAVTNGHMDDIPVDNIIDFESKLHQFAETNFPKVLDLLSTGEKIKEKETEALEKLIREFKKTYRV